MWRSLCRRRSSAALAVLWCAACGAPRDPLAAFPRVMLWAWEQPDDLSYTDPSRVGIAFLARTVTLGNGTARVRPRLQPLRFPPGAALMAVVRIDSLAPPLPAAVETAQLIVPAANLTGVRAVQIDFDARLSERAWYADVLRDLRAALPPHLPLTITALASWCEADAWIRGLPVDDAVPMLFRMGAGETGRLSESAPALCRHSVGLSTDELAGNVPRGRRLFFFHPGPWTPAAYQGVMGEAARRR